MPYLQMNDCTGSTSKRKLKFESFDCNSKYVVSFQPLHFCNNSTHLNNMYGCVPSIESLKVIHPVCLMVHCSLFITQSTWHSRKKLECNNMLMRNLVAPATPSGIPQGKSHQKVDVNDAFSTSKVV